MAPLLIAAVKAILVKRATKSLTSWIGGAVAAGGAAAAVNPELLELIPEGARGPAMTAIGVAIVIARHRKEITQLYRDLRAALAPKP